MPVRVEVVPHNPQWRQAFEQEAAQIRPIFGVNLIAIHHIGSTAIPGIFAKPIIDFLVVVSDIKQVDEIAAEMTALGYEAMGEFGLPGRRYFRKENNAGIRTHHIHTYGTNSASSIERHLAFRDYLIAHPDAAQQYSQFKQNLVKTLAIDDINGYMDGKDAFVKEMEQRAVEWKHTQP